MNFIKTKLDGVYIVEPKVFGDHRGNFMETWSCPVFREAGFSYEFCQDNQSFTQKKGTLRGLHVQLDPASQAKLVRVASGAVLDVAVDLRRGSPTYLQWVAEELSAENKRMMLIPRGFAHGFLTLTDDVTFIYRVDNLYAPKLDRSIRFDDPSIGVNWGIENPILSAKDLAAPLLSDSDVNFTYEKRKPRVLVTGAKGQLGHDVMLALGAKRFPRRGIDIQDCDLTDEAAVMACVEDYRPDCIVHCAAYTNVDKAEVERELCYRVNVDATRYLAIAAEKVGAKLIYFSTDYVFDGSGSELWKPEDEPHPCNYYGETKYLGERAVQENCTRHFIVRTSWVYGANGKNFVKTMLRLSETQDTIEVVNDQFGMPTYTRDLARLTREMVESEKYGIYHATPPVDGSCMHFSWFDFAKTIMHDAGRDTKIVPISSGKYRKKFPMSAVRPSNSRLDCSKLVEAGFAPLTSHDNAVQVFLDEIGELSK